MITKYRRRLSDLLDRLASATADPYFLALFRITYALVALLVALRTYEQAAFLWYPNSFTYKAATYGVLPALIVLLVCILVGFGGRLVVALHFAVFAVLNGIFPMVGYLDFRLNQAAAFWMAFMRLNKVWSLDAALFPERVRREPPPSAWPVHFLGVSLGLWFLNAGFLKFSDPLWRDGLGFYYVFLLPWIKPAHVNFILEHHFALVVLNYVAIAFEISFLFLYIFRKTRPIALLLAIIFFINLVYPLRIDPIGQLGLAWCLALLSVTTLPSKLRGVLGQFGKGRPAATGVPAWRLRLRRYFIVGAAAFILYLFVVFHVRAMPFYNFRQGLVTFVGYPFALLEGTEKANAKEPRAVRGMKWALHGLYRPLRRVDAPLFFVNQYTTSIQFNGLFGIEHVLGLYLYRVELEMDDGSRLEPVAVFNEDMTAGPYSAGLFTPRYLQGAMYGVSGLCLRLTTRPGYAPSAGEIDLLKRLINQSVSKLDASQAQRLRRAILKVRPILVPEGYAGNARAWEARGWTDFYVYEPASGQYRFESLPEKYPLRIPLKTFSNGWLVLEP